MAKQINILSIDPSTTCCGWAMLSCTEKWQDIKLDEYGKIRPKGDSLYNRRSDLVCQLFDIPKYGLACIDYVFIEKAPLPFNDVARRSIARLQTTIDILHHDINTEVPLEQIFGVNAQTWKGSEKKHRTLSRCNLLYGLEIKDRLCNYDMTDSIMMGTWFIERMRVSPLEPFHLSSC